MPYRSYNNNSVLNVITVDKRNDFGPSAGAGRTEQRRTLIGSLPERTLEVGRARSAVRSVRCKCDVAVSERFLQSEHVSRQLSGAYTLLRSGYAAQ